MGKNKILSLALANAKKSDEDKLAEKVNAFIESAVLDCEEQIGRAEIDVKRAQGAVTKAERALERAKANAESAQYGVPASGRFEDYVGAVNSANISVDNAQEALDEAVEFVATVEAEVESYKAMLKNLQAEA